MSKSRRPRSRKDLRCTDAFMLRLYNELTSDFASEYSSLRVECPFENVHSERPRATYFLSEYAYFKRRYQLENLFKRYRFNSDVYTDAELEDKANAKFIETQIRISQIRKRTHRSYLVIQEARNIISKILGKYDEEEHLGLCNFGKRADVGVSAHDAYLDRKITSPLTGSLEHIEWFKQNYLPTDKLLSDIITQSEPLHEGKPSYVVCESLKLVNVPKTFKSYRSIMPNTRLGAFYSFGLGKVIQERLKEYGLDIQKLQYIHQILARRYSKTKTHATADLSAASDSFIAPLVNMLVPREWYNILKKGRISSCIVDECEIQLQSFMTMGVGFTFPLQTLLFFALLKAIQRLSKIEGQVSVYGDDMIYPSRMHQFVKTIFTDIGFLLNDDKTFVTEDFRESCGGDYYCGIDVRPFQPEGQHQQLTPIRFAGFVYKIYNGLCRRWDKCEIPRTLQFLKRELCGALGGIHQVPPHYPDYSGVRVDVPLFNPPWYEPWFRIEYDGNLSIRFRCLKQISNDRPVECVDTYFWDSLRDLHVVPPYKAELTFDPIDYFRRIGRIDTPLKQWLCDQYIVKAEKLRWLKIDHDGQKHVYRSKKSGKRVQRLFPYEARKMDAGRILHQTVTVPSWTVILPCEIGKPSLRN